MIIYVVKYVCPMTGPMEVAFTSHALAREFQKLRVPEQTNMDLVVLCVHTDKFWS